MLGTGNLMNRRAIVVGGWIATGFVVLSFAALMVFLMLRAGASWDRVVLAAMPGLAFLAIWIRRGKEIRSSKKPSFQDDSTDVRR